MHGNISFEGPERLVIVLHLGTLLLNVMKDTDPYAYKNENLGVPDTFHVCR